jgi:hypothetical protein
MPKGGIRPRSSDGSVAHLLQPKWKQGKTRTIRVPVVLADQLLEIAHHLDSGGKIELTQDNKRLETSNSIDLTQDNTTAHHPSPDDLTPDKQLDLEVERERFLASLKVGRQAPEYKRTKAVIERFIAFCRDTSQKSQVDSVQHDK